MNKSFYPKLAVSNIVKNRKIYFPYILTCIFTVMMFYMMSSIKYNKNLDKVYGADNLVILLQIAIFVTALFSIIFLFYTNSFLIKRRKKEIGLYNILGMEKRHIGKMMFYETLIIAVVSLSVGLLLGILLSKMMFLFLLKLISFDVILGFDIPIRSVISSLVLFGGIFLITYLYNLAKIHLTKPIELLHGGEIGEKEPKTKIILTLIGLATTGWGYWFALTVESPLSAMNYFFVAVIAVIIGTYALFTAGSIAVLKLLRKNKNFYYNTKHFTSVSGMLYRMKQNAVGLANICILSTMVLIMFSTTVSLYAGIEDSIEISYPSDIAIQTSIDSIDKTEAINQEINRVVSDSNIEIENYVSFHTLQLVCELNDKNNCIIQSKNINGLSIDNLKMCVIIPLEEFNKTNNTNYQLNENEVIMYSKGSLNNFNDDIIFSNGQKSLRFEVKDKLHKISKYHNSTYERILDYYVVVVNSMDKFSEINEMAQVSNSNIKQISYGVFFNSKSDKAGCVELTNYLTRNASIEGAIIYADNKFESRDDFYGMYGGFFFIGIFLGLLFLMATVLIIYYKQISEGFEDKERFEIMQKVGISRADVKKTIRSQVLMVFFLPLVVTGIHIAVSYRIIAKMLLLLGLANTGLFILCTIGAMLIFCLVYGIVFTITARSYYKIVSYTKND